MHLTELRSPDAVKTGHCHLKRAELCVEPALPIFMKPAV